MLSIVCFTIFYLITAAMFYNIVIACPVLGIVMEVVIFLWYVNIVKSALNAYVCLIHSKGMDLPSLKTEAEDIILTLTLVSWT